MAKVMKVNAYVVTNRETEWIEKAKEMLARSGVTLVSVRNGNGAASLCDGDIQFPVNVGCPAATNAAIADAISGGADFMVRIDDDCEMLTEDWLKRSLEIMERNPRVGVIGPKILCADGTVTSTGPIRLTTTGWSLGRGVPRADLDVSLTTRVSVVTGVFLFFRVAALKDVGDFDLVFTPTQYDDVDYCFRMWDKDWHVVYDGKQEVVHHSDEVLTPGKRFASIAHYMALDLKYGMQKGYGALLESRIEEVGREVALG